MPGFLPESDYEEIAAPPPTMSAGAAATETPIDGGDMDLCDLCGTSRALVRCQACSGQLFCLACDDMYHRHPKRVAHSRKALPADYKVRPPLPPKGEMAAGPVAPPRRTSAAGGSRKGSTPGKKKKICSGSKTFVIPYPFTPFYQTS